MNARSLASSLFLLISLVFSTTLYAEPWLASRYAENCSSCHSPARRNLQPKDRRCTLACQGCHVNPNGGGLRNEYGVWNQQRFLRSFKWAPLGNKGTPAPLKYQKYGSMPKDMASYHADEEVDASTDSKNTKKSKAKSAAKKTNKTSENNRWKSMAKSGAPLVVVPGVEYRLEDHDKFDGEYEITVKSREEFMARLTEEDPYRLERKKSVFAGGDFRYFYLDGTWDPDTGTTKTFSGAMFPMALDVGVKVRPTPENVSLVFEHRYFNGPIPEGSPGADNQSSWDRLFTGTNSTSQVRSAYLMVDDLPYATYAMYGLYRPMFGHMNADHTTLLNSIITADNRASGGYSYNQYTAASAKMIHKAVTLGGSPNVPFANLHFIFPTDGEKIHSGYRFTQDSGLALNLGGRFVTLGAYFMFSWWSTTGPRELDGVELANDMMSLTTGLTFKDMILNIDMTQVSREFEPGRADEGAVQTIEFKYRFWREMYGVFNYATSNVARNLKKGSSNEISYGLKSFLVPGLEFELLMVSKEDRNGVTNEKTLTDLMQAQLHAYF